MLRRTKLLVLQQNRQNLATKERKRLELTSRKDKIRSLEKWNDFRRRRHIAKIEYYQTKRFCEQKFQWFHLWRIRCLLKHWHMKFIVKVEIVKKRKRIAWLMMSIGRQWRKAIYKVSGLKNSHDRMQRLI